MGLSMAHLGNTLSIRILFSNDVFARRSTELVLGIDVASDYDSVQISDEALMNRRTLLDIPEDIILFCLWSHVTSSRVCRSFRVFRWTC